MNTSYASLPAITADSEYYHNVTTACLVCIFSLMKNLEIYGVDWSLHVFTYFAAVVGLSSPWRLCLVVQDERFTRELRADLSFPGSHRTKYSTHAPKVTQFILRHNFKRGELRESRLSLPQKSARSSCDVTD